MDHIIAIIDMDGFPVQNNFLCKELGILKVGEQQARSFFFDIGFHGYKQLDPKDRKTCRYVSKYIHKLPLGVPPFCKHALPLNSLETILCNFYNAWRLDEKSAIAYKGGIVEKKLLGRLNIPSINLEDLGCPKVSMLFDELKHKETCGHHLEQNAYQHCPKVEVEAFGQWLTSQKN